jgi:CRP-like cAMP-binding protein
MKSVDFGDGESIVRQGEPGHSMYIVVSGRAVVTLEDSGVELATIEAGGYFGEMSLLTGDPRTATVIARGDVALLEIDAEVFRELADVSPQAVEQVGVAAAARRVELNAARATARTAAVIEAPASFVARMRKFLRI